MASPDFELIVDRGGAPSITVIGKSSASDGSAASLPSPLILMEVIMYGPSIDKPRPQVNLPLSIGLGEGCASVAAVQMGHRATSVSPAQIDSAA